MTKRMLLTGSALAVMVLASPAIAATKNYSYDTLGRLVGTTSNTGPVVTTTIAYDPAGNRTSYSISGASTSSSTSYRVAAARSSSSSTKASTSTDQSAERTPVIAPALSGDNGLKSYAGN